MLPLSKLEMQWRNHIVNGKSKTVSSSRFFKFLRLLAAYF
jgi:hypothetical protein